MARARNIKPGFFTNDVLAECSALARILFQGLWCHADREGRLEDRPRKLKAEILPYDDCNAEELLCQLESRGFIVRYLHGSERFIQVVNFCKHQNPHIKESESTIPAPCLSGANTELAGLIPDSLNPITDSLNLIPDSPSPSVGGDEKKSGDNENFPDAIAPAPEKQETELQASCKQTWAGYSLAYEQRYQVKPVRNQKVNALVKQFVQRIGFEESPLIAEWFVLHPGGYYVGRMHDFGCLLSDAEKLRTEWATGRVMTQGKARQSDRSGTNASALAEVLAEMGEPQ